MNESSTVDRMTDNINTSSLFDQRLVETILNTYYSLSQFDMGRATRQLAWSGLIGLGLKLDDQEIKEAEIASLFCDIGMWGMPDNIVSKKDRLTLTEFKVIQSHPQISLDTMKNIHLSDGIRSNILCHHESYDGSGYPQGLTGRSIPMGAQVVNLTCALFAMTSKRPWRNPIPFDVTIDLLKKESGKQYNPDVVKALDNEDVVAGIAKVFESEINNPFKDIEILVKTGDPTQREKSRISQLSSLHDDDHHQNLDALRSSIGEDN